MQQFQENPDMFWPDWIGKDPTADDTVALHFLFHDCSHDTAAWALGTRRLMYARGALTHPYPLQRWPDVRMSYILCRDDRTLRPEFWRKRVEVQLGVVPIELAGGHCPHVSRPAELAHVLCELIQ